MRLLFKKVNKDLIPNIEEKGGQKILETFGALDSHIVPDDNKMYMFGLLAKNPYRFMRAFEQAYKKIDSMYSFSEMFTPQVKTIITALETGDFSEGGKYYKKKEIKIPDDIDVNNDMELATYFVKETGSDNVKMFYNNNLYLLGTLIKIDDEKILITSKSDVPDGRECVSTTIGVYKSDKRTSDKKLVEKVMGEIMKPLSFKKEYKGKGQEGYRHPEDNYTYEEIGISETPKNDPDYLNPGGDYIFEDLISEITGEDTQVY